ncbi:hypothetical protein F385_1873 [Pantoea agglomerans 299R]|uniref:hypothetical protein n=1 Tax=Pantoea sp. MHSD4 TaxID=2898077 RepID=UPI0002A6BC78|nr:MULTISPECIES: hypothetical protein [Pantoea]ELP25171.1 hypothetical protein F385_1873 [Pantoea agglomerans 299R]MCD2358905.1 hypothetical protein [Pantoea sp. MHSD4]PQL26374.1 hypothetical protein C5L22_21020 [Pantoea ananatis]
MDRSTYPLLSEKEFVEIAARMLAGEYKNTKGFIRDLAEFLLTAGDSAMTRNREFTRDIYFLSEHHLIESIITWQAWRGISGLRPEKLH